MDSVRGNSPNWFEKDQEKETKMSKNSKPAKTTEKAATTPRIPAEERIDKVTKCQLQLKAAELKRDASNGAATKEEKPLVRFLSSTYQVLSRCKTKSEFRAVVSDQVTGLENALAAIKTLS